MIEEMNSHSAFRRMKNRLGINRESASSPSLYRALNQIKRALASISTQDANKIRQKIYYKHTSKMTNGAMMDKVVTRLEKFDELSINYLLKKIDEDGIVPSFTLFFLSIAKLHALAMKDQRENELKMAA